MKVAVIMGSSSDWEIMKESCNMLEEFGIPYEKKVVSAHRTPHLMVDFASHAVNDGYDLIIAGAGGAAHLPGMVASMTTLPVIGVPIESKSLKGLDSLLAIVQMPGGIPVATTAIGKSGAKNAGILAARILGISHSSVRKNLENYEKSLVQKWRKCKMNFNKLSFGATIGIIGGGQLGKMMAQSAQKMGYKVIVLDPNIDCPCRYVAHEFIHAEYDDEKALQQLGDSADVITYEFENISANQLKSLTDKYNIPQGYQAIELLQDRLTEKQTLEQAGTQIVPYTSIKNKDDLSNAVSELGYPFIVKTRFGGYDGKGQVLVKTEEDLEEAETIISKQECVAEKFLEIDKEVSLTVTIGNHQQITYFPLQENEHRNQILFKTIVPARSDKTESAKREVEKITNVVHFVGTFTVEFFIDENNHLYVNEIAPRPHNSGHYSIEACDYSQFDTHILAVTGQSLPQQIEVLKPAVMMNLLGKDLDLLEHEFGEHPEWHVHIYGKSERKPNRKMGHMTILTNDIDETEKDMLKRFEGREG